MADPGSSSASTTPSTGEATRQDTLERRFQSLHLLFVATLMALLILCLGVDFYLWYQVKLVRKDLTGTSAFLEDYQKNKEPALNRLITGLQTLAQNYPDLTPILEKYGIKSPVADQSSQPAAAPSTPPAKPGK